MRTCKFKFKKNLFFLLIGLHDFNADIKSIECKDGEVIIKINGEDERLPDRKDYPNSAINMNSRIVVIEEDE